jgi:dienelactone hydrolase
LSSRSDTPSLTRRFLVFAASLAAAVALAVALRSAARQVRTLTPPRGAVPRLDSLHTALSLQDVSFRTTDGLLIRGWYGASQNGAAVALLHGWADTRAGMLPEAEMLATAGFGVLLFDWRAHGESEGTHTTWGADEQRDLEAAVTWLGQEHSGLQIGALGFSMGGMTLVEEASHDRRLRAIALEGMYPSLEDVAYQMESRFGFLTGFPSIWAMRVFGPPLDSVRPVDRLCSLSPRPVLLVYGTEEQAARYDLTRRIFDAACEPKELWMVAHAVHGQYARADADGLKTKLVGFFSRALGAPEGFEEKPRSF